METTFSRQYPHKKHTGDFYKISFRRRRFLFRLQSDFRRHNTNI